MATRADEMIEPFVRLAATAGFDDASCAEAELTLRALAHECGWGPRATTAPLLPSGIRHGAPWGLSFVLGAGAPEVRMLVEAQAEPATAASYWSAVRRVNAWIATQPGADLSRARAIEAAFTPSATSRFRGWHAVAFRPNQAPRYRVYWCAENDRARVDAALATLGLSGARAAIDDRADDELTIVSLDLHAHARTKVYRLRPHARARDAVSTADRDDADRFAQRMLGDADRAIGWLTCFALDATRAPTCALHLSLERHVAAADVAPRVVALCEALAIDARPYRAALATLQPRHHFVSWQRVDGAPRLTIYFLPDVAR